MTYAEAQRQLASRKDQPELWEHYWRHTYPVDDVEPWSEASQAIRLRWARHRLALNVLRDLAGQGDDASGRAARPHLRKLSEAFRQVERGPSPDRPRPRYK